MDIVLNAIGRLSKEKIKIKLTSLAKFERLSNPKKVKIVYDALDYMEQCNSRSKYDCITLAMDDEFN